MVEVGESGGRGYLFTSASTAHSSIQLPVAASTEPKNRLAGESQDFCEQEVCVSELGNWQSEVSDLQMLSRVTLRLTEVSCFVSLHFLAFGTSEKDYPCNRLSLHSFIVVSSFT